MQLQSPVGEREEGTIVVVHLHLLLLEFWLLLLLQQPLPLLQLVLILQLRVHLLHHRQLTFVPAMHLPSLVILLIL